jgi:homoserine O-acetyltransferase
VKLKNKIAALLVAAFTFGLNGALAADTNFPPPFEGNFVIHDFHFNSGETLPELRIHYRTLGTPQRDRNGHVRNAILIMHGTTGTGAQFLRGEFAGELFPKGQPLDVSRYYLIMPDDIGHGQSSKPSDGLHAKFPRYGYLDMIEAERRLIVDGLGVNHLRLVMGTSMGGMHTWLWGEVYPDMMDGLMPLASLPTQISGRNRVWRRVVTDAIRGAPDWQNGDYQAQPYGLKTAAETLYFMGSNPAIQTREMPTLEKADAVLNA